MAGKGTVVCVLFLIISMAAANDTLNLWRHLRQYKKSKMELGKRQDLEDTVFGPLCVTSTRYKLFLTQLLWDEAKEACQTDGGMLAKIQDEASHQLIKDYIQATKLKQPINDRGKGLWIGLTDRKEEGKYVWVDGEELDMDDPDAYVPWAEGEPNDNTKKDPNGQDCVQLWKSRDFDWDDAYCEDQGKGYVCQYSVCDPVCVKCT